MAGQLVIHGLPDTLRNDGWWLEGDAATPARPRARMLKPLGVTLALVVVADQSLWRHNPGISVAVTYMALSVAMLAMKPDGASRRDWVLGLGVSLVSLLPVVEQVQALSLGFAALGLAMVLCLVTRDRIGGMWEIGTIFLRTATASLTELPEDVVGDLRSRQGRIDWRVAVQTGAVPVGAGIAFLFLFASANPLLGEAIGGLLEIDWPTGDGVVRVAFWVLTACLTYPFVSPKWLRRAAPLEMPVLTRPPIRGQFLTPRSVPISLVVFNAMFLAQTLSDIAVLSGGVTLPQGMTYAEYAHRGAYPLVLTALLAGLFTLISQPMIAKDKTLRLMVYAWLGQTLILVLTAAFRLGLYVQAYSLTYLRLAAFIWMGLVLIGLILILVQIAQARSIGWLVRAQGLSAAITLYACCFVNFGHVIVDYNLNAGVPTAELDLAYLCAIGEQAIPVMMDQGPVTDGVVCGTGDRPAIQYDPIESWQEWGFRRWRLQLYLAAHHDL